MKKVYRVYVLGETPADLQERIARLHASAILTSDSKDGLFRKEGLSLPNKKLLRSKITPPK